MKRTILFYGPLGQKNKPVLGGSETSNRRTIKILHNNSFKVIPVPKPYHILRNPIGEIIYLFHLAIFQLYLIGKVTSVKGPKSVHICGYYYNMIYFEYFLNLAFSILRVKTIYEIRAGGLKPSYNERFVIYKYFLKKTLQSASTILTQGYSDIEFIKTLTDRPVFHYPNYVKDELISANNLDKRIQSSVIELVYFGRFAPSKRIDLMIGVCKHLKDKGCSFHFELIGNIDKKYSQAADQNYLEMIKDKIASYQLNDIITFTPSQDTAALMKILESKHFYLFPTMEKREGHSNSLTEAMSRGVVPIASPNGFNRSVINDERLIVEQFDAKAYAERILDVWRTGLWATCSDKVYKNVLDNYTESKVSSTLINAYRLADSTLL